MKLIAKGLLATVVVSAFAGCVKGEPSADPDVTSEAAAQTRADLVQDGVLVLPSGVGSLTIHVASIDRDGVKTPVFGLDAVGPWYPAGFSWKFQPDQPLVVTFDLGPDVASVKTSHRELQCSTAINRKQQMRIPAAARTYDFDVEFSSGALYDPVIVVTPIDTGG